MTQPSPIVLVNNGASEPITVSPSEEISFALQDDAGVNVWTLTCVSADPQHIPDLEDFTGGIFLNQLTKDGYFVMPSDACTLQFESIVNQGIDGTTGLLNPALVSRFVVHVPTAAGVLLPCISELNWEQKMDHNLRLITSGGGGGGDGYFHAAGDLSGDGYTQTVIRVNGASIPAAGALTVGTVPQVTSATSLGYALLGNSNISSSAGIHGSKINPDFAAQDVTTSGSVQATSFRVGTSGPTITKGSGAPASSEPNGSIYLRTDGYAYSRQSGTWQVLGSGGGGSFTAAGDLSGDGSSQTVLNISGTAGTAGISASSLQWAAATSNPTIKQADRAGSGTGAPLKLQAQNAPASSSTGGNIILASGTGSSSAGAVILQTGATDRFKIEPSLITISVPKSKRAGTKQTIISDAAEATTTNATATTIYSFTLTNNCSTTVDVNVSCNQTSGTLAGNFKRTALFRNVSNSVSQVSSTIDNGSVHNGSGWDVTITFSSTTCFIQVKGQASTTLNWGADILIQEMAQ